MKRIQKIVSVILAVFVLLIAVGVNISKMKCDDDGALYFGTEVPSCSMEKEVACELSQKKVSCCMAEIEKTCCPETKDNSCASETELFHFDFETLVTSSNINFSIVSVMDVFLTISSSNYINLKVVKYLSGIPPPKLKKPVLSQIQSFLL